MQQEALWLILATPKGNLLAQVAFFAGADSGYKDGPVAKAQLVAYLAETIERHTPVKCMPYYIYIDALQRVQTPDGQRGYAREQTVLAPVLEPTCPLYTTVLAFQFVQDLTAEEQRIIREGINHANQAALEQRLSSVGIVTASQIPPGQS